MPHFALIFVPAMYLMPIIVAASVRAQPDAGGDPQLARARMIRLGVVTVLSLVAFGTVHHFVGPMAVHMWPLFFILFFGFAVPVLAAKNPALVNVHAGYDRSVRAATLVNRTHASPLRTGHWVVVWTIAIASVVLVISGLFRNLSIAAVDDGASTSQWMHLGLSFGTLIVWLPMLAFLSWSIRLVLCEPEPMDVDGTAELALAYTRHRNFKVWSFYVLFGIGMNLHICVIAVGAAWQGPAHSLGVLGAVGGILAGVAGGVVGTIAGVQRMRITRLLRELRQRNPSAVAGAV